VTLRVLGSVLEIYSAILILAPLVAPLLSGHSDLAIGSRLARPLGPGHPHALRRRVLGLR